LEHAAYLGRELESAYIALKTGRSYQQDEDPF
jgi:dihydropteroate synthase